MSFSRTIEPELLDALTPDDPRALRARRDLQRVNTIMGHTLIWKRILRERISPGKPPAHIVELGTGDGTLLLGLARTLARHWPRVRLQLVDCHPAVTNETLEAYAALGWQAQTVTADVMDWISTMPQTNLITANLFLHHFSDTRLAELFRHIAGKTDVFAACEPRRSSLALLGSHLLGLIGCGPVTRYDAVVSVRAGFSGAELSALWPRQSNWQLHENRAGLFSHIFIAQHPPAFLRVAQA
jgi:hypothetical protein